MKKLLLPLVLFFSISTTSLLADEVVSSSQFLSSGGGNSNDIDYSNFASIGGSFSGSSYGTEGVLLSQITPISTFAIDTTNPTVADVKFDNITAKNGDYIKSGSILTATISDDVAVSLTSYILIDGTAYRFDSLPSGSTYSSNVLTFVVPTLSAGSHSISIVASDSSGNSSSKAYSVAVNDNTQIASSVLFYPNPFNPNNETGKLGYQLSKDSETILFIFNSIGQVTYKKVFQSGTEGGHVGYNEVDWDGKDSLGKVVGNDIYFVKIISENKVLGGTKVAVIK